MPIITQGEPDNRAQEWHQRRNHLRIPRFVGGRIFQADWPEGVEPDSPDIEVTYDEITTQLNVTTTATGTLHWLLDEETEQDVGDVVAGGGEASGSAAVSGNGTFIIDLTGVSADDYKLHIVLIRSGDDAPSNVVTLDITVLGLFLGIEATGGTELEYEDSFGQWWRSHDLPTGTGALVCTVGGPIRLLAVGGGAGASGTGGGGAGAGGVVNKLVSDNFMLAAGSHNVTVGARGDGAVGLGNNGSPTILLGVTALGGGRSGNTATRQAQDGGCGGGSGYNDTTGAFRGFGQQESQAAPSTGLGKNGQRGGSGAGGGGGGSTTAGGGFSNINGGPGGAGFMSDIRTGTAEEFAAGGGGAGNTAGGAAGGSTAGAGATGTANGGDATAGRGSGGGGSRQTGRGGHGGSGRAIIAYPIPTPTP